MCEACTDYYLLGAQGDFLGAPANDHCRVGGVATCQDYVAEMRRVYGSIAVWCLYLGLVERDLQGRLLRDCVESYHPERVELDGERGLLRLDIEI